MKKTFIAWLILICIAIAEIKEIGHGEPIIRTTPNSAWKELNEINQTIIKEHIQFEHRISDEVSTTQIQIPRPPSMIETTKPKISFIVACHNEGVTAQQALNNLIKYEKDYDIEIIAVDNLSADDTFKQLMSVTDSRIQIDKYEKRLDYTAAIRSGILKSKGKYVLIVEPMLSTKLFNIKPLVFPLMRGEALAVFLSRFKNGQIRRSYLLKILTLLIRLFSGIFVKDPIPLCIAYDGNLIRQIAECTVQGNFNLSALYWMGRQKIPLIEVPLHMCSEPLHRKRL